MAELPSLSAPRWAQSPAMFSYWEGGQGKGRVFGYSGEGIWLQWGGEMRGGTTETSSPSTRSARRLSPAEHSFRKSAPARSIFCTPAQHPPSQVRPAKGGIRAGRWKGGGRRNGHKKNPSRGDPGCVHRDPAVILGSRRVLRGVGYFLQNGCSSGGFRESASARLHSPPIGANRRPQNQCFGADRPLTSFRAGRGQICVPIKIQKQRNLIGRSWASTH